MHMSQPPPPPPRLSAYDNISLGVVIEEPGVGQQRRRVLQGGVTHVTQPLHLPVVLGQCRQPLPQPLQQAVQLAHTGRERTQSDVSAWSHGHC